MVDFVKRAARAGEGVLGPGEEVRGAVNVTPSPFLVPNAGMAGGMMAGGVVGAVIGSAVDRKNLSKGAMRPVPTIAARTPLDPGISANGALLAVTDRRVLLWRISGLGKPKGVFQSIEFGDIDAIAWEAAGAEYLAGRAKAVMLWLGTKRGEVLAAAAIAAGPAAKYASGAVDALVAGCPGIVSMFDPGE